MKRLDGDFTDRRIDRVGNMDGAGNQRYFMGLFKDGGLIVSKAGKRSSSGRLTRPLPKWATHEDREKRDYCELLEMEIK